MSSKTLWKNDSLPASAGCKSAPGADASDSPVTLHPALSTPPAPIVLETEQHRWVSPVGWKPGDPDLEKAEVLKTDAVPASEDKGTDKGFVGLLQKGWGLLVEGWKMLSDRRR